MNVALLMTLAGLCILASGCYTVKDVEEYAHAHPVVRSFIDDNVGSETEILEGEWLVGKWQSGSRVDGAFYKTTDLGVKKTDWGFNHAVVYEFRDDKSVNVDVTVNGMTASASGMWMYEHGILRMKFSTYDNQVDKVSVAEFSSHPDVMVSKAVLNSELDEKNERNVKWYGPDAISIGWRIEENYNAWWDEFMGRFFFLGQWHDERNGHQTIATAMQHDDGGGWRLRSVRDGGRLFGASLIDAVGRRLVFRRISPRTASPIPRHEIASKKPDRCPEYTIISCKRDSRNGFSYRFVLELKGGDQSSLGTFSTVQKEFREAVKVDYAESFPNVKKDSLFVDFPEYELDNGKIMGRAVVLTMSVTSLTYDPNTRTGKLAVKVNANQYEEARKWIRKNIETLARDKNIALTTGEIPPAAKFYLGREELKDGNVLEIEFKTE